MPEQHLEKTLSDLLSQREQRVAEIARLDAAIEAIQKLVGSNSANTASISVSVSDALKQQDSVRAVLGVIVKPGDFFGKSQAEAAQEYLHRRGTAADLNEILGALQKGGAILKGKEPRKNLYISLVKRKDIFALVAPYTFGLWEFYPGARKKPAGKKGKEQSQIFEQLKEVMQDGKSHRIVEILALLQQKFGQTFVRPTVVSALRRGKEFRRVRRGTFKLR